MMIQNKFGYCALIALLICLSIASGQQPSEIADLTGELEILHADDFEHPENSKYIFYLVTDSQRYELVSEKQLPVVVSGTQANVKGRLHEGKIMVEEFNVQPASTALSEEEQLILEEESGAKSKLNLIWLYAGAPIAIILALLVYIELKRKKDHSQLIQQKKQHNMLVLRNYVASNLRKGYTKEQIRNALVRYNYSKEEIEEAFRGIR